ncbi:MAG: TIGR03067 domain-containing protein [Planctomycetia bacterium]|nr:TIGR03067 domain-containing protein [Planctomycetia bacterium]
MWCLLIGLLMPVADEPKQADLTAMQGEWGCTLNIRNGQRQPDDVAETLFRDVKDDVVIVSLFDKALQKSKIKLNPQASPKEIDSTMLDGPAKDKVSLGIYEFKDGQLYLCVAQPGQPRPTSFESKPGSNTSLTVWKLNKK